MTTIFSFHQNQRVVVTSFLENIEIRRLFLGGEKLDFASFFWRFQVFQVG